MKKRRDLFKKVIFESKKKEKDDPIADIPLTTGMG
jgi:hypothetical protein